MIITKPGFNEIVKMISLLNDYLCLQNDIGEYVELFCGKNSIFGKQNMYSRTHGKEVEKLIKL